MSEKILKKYDFLTKYKTKSMRENVYFLKAKLQNKISIYLLM